MTMGDDNLHRTLYNLIINQLWYDDLGSIAAQIEATIKSYNTHPSDKLLNIIKSAELFAEYHKTASQFLTFSGASLPTLRPPKSVDEYNEMITIHPGYLSACINVATEDSGSQHNSFITSCSRKRAIQKGADDVAISQLSNNEDISSVQTHLDNHDSCNNTTIPATAKCNPEKPMASSLSCETPLSKEVQLSVEQRSAIMSLLKEGLQVVYLFNISKMTRHIFPDSSVYRNGQIIVSLARPEEDIMDLIDLKLGVDGDIIVSLIGHKSLIEKNVRKDIPQFTSNDKEKIKSHILSKTIGYWNNITALVKCLSIKGTSSCNTGQLLVGVFGSSVMQYISLGLDQIGNVTFSVIKSDNVPSDMPSNNKPVTVAKMGKLTTSLTSNSPKSPQTSTCAPGQSTGPKASAQKKLILTNRQTDCITKLLLQPTVVSQLPQLVKGFITNSTRYSPEEILIALYGPSFRQRVKFALDAKNYATVCITQKVKVAIQSAKPPLKLARSSHQVVELATKQAKAPTPNFLMPPPPSLPAVVKKKPLVFTLGHKHKVISLLKAEPYLHPGQLPWRVARLISNHEIGRSYSTCEVLFATFGDEIKERVYFDDHEMELLESEQETNLSVDQSYVAVIDDDQSYDVENETLCDSYYEQLPDDLSDTPILEPGCATDLGATETITPINVAEPLPQITKPPCQSPLLTFTIEQKNTILDYLQGRWIIAFKLLPIIVCDLISKPHCKKAHTVRNYSWYQILCALYGSEVNEFVDLKNDTTAFRLKKFYPRLTADSHAVKQSAFGADKLELSSTQKEQAILLLVGDKLRPCFTVPHLMKSLVPNAMFYSAKEIFKAVFGKRCNDYVLVVSEFRVGFEFMGKEWYRVKNKTEVSRSSAENASCSLQ